ncbi:hypothetical protein EI94DRAFT_1816931 [Lactarius quietus]|nr:hypothetical protein EI94DRAFT_1816927 [Lactarius quietus]KAF8257788.1 hypothetical protein EI94DRAFT_1816931 [Lactarius quietus]
MPAPDATIDAERSPTERQLIASDLHGLKKSALQGIVHAQIDKWPSSVYGRYTSKTNMTTLRAALLNPEFGFTIQDDFNEPDDHRARSSDDQQGSPDNDQAVTATSADQPIQGAAADSNEPDGHRTTPVHSSDDRQVQGSHDKGQATASVGAEQPVEGVATDSNEPGPAGPNYGIGGLDTINPASYEPLGMGQGQLFNGSNNGQPLTFDISSYTMPDFTNNGSNFMVTDSASVSKDNPVHPFMSDNNNASFRDSLPMFTNANKLGGYPTTAFDDAGQTSPGQACSTDVGAKPSRRTHGSARDPTKRPSKQERSNKTVEWLMKELQSHPGYEEFRLTMNHIKDNPSAVRSWTFAVDFMEDYQKSCLVNGAYQKISKLDITRALSVGISWFHDANKAVEILKKFGEGGTHSSQEVIDRISFTAGAPEGSTSLLRWLRTWETENPI